METSLKRNKQRVSRSSRLEFKDLVVSSKSKILLNNVSGSASSGDLLAVMGHSGAGKTTLLNVLAGRIARDSGTITLNGSPLNKAQRRRFGYVMQDDILMSNLTLWESLYFTAMIRIPDEVPKQEKIDKIHKIVDVLGLQKSLHTAVGDIFKRGLSGGEKKRTNVACELLTDPDILLLDEPTSGLDSSTAYTLMVQLKSYATEYNKTIIANIHQPSSQVFRMFTTLLILVEGQIAYFGEASRVTDHFTELEMTCCEHFNPADFLLEIATEKRVEKDIESIRSLHSQATVSMTMSGDTGSIDTITEIGGENNEQEKDYHTRYQGRVRSSSDIRMVEEGCDGGREITRRWPTSLWTQFKMLTWRSYKQSKGRILHKFELMLAGFIAAFSAMVFFQTTDSINTIRDRMGLVMMSLSFWSFRMFHATVLGFTVERAVVRKDRASGAYRLSAYYLSKLASDMPLLLIIPFLFNTVVYWLTGLGGVNGYVVYICIGILNCLLTQSLARIFGVLFTDPRLSVIIGNVITIGGIILGGFLNINPPDWIQWVKYVTLVHYPYAATMSYLLKDMPDVWCNQTSTDIYIQCIANATDVLTSRDILVGIGVDLPIYCYIMTNVLAILIFLILGYYTLKWKRL